jgi:hypothetical protein
MAAVVAVVWQWRDSDGSMVVAVKYSGGGSVVASPCIRNLKILSA